MSAAGDGAPISNWSPAVSGPAGMPPVRSGRMWFWNGGNGTVNSLELLGREGTVPGTVLERSRATNRPRRVTGIHRRPLRDLDKVCWGNGRRTDHDRIQQGAQKLRRTGKREAEWPSSVRVRLVMARAASALGASGTGQRDTGSSKPPIDIRSNTGLPACAPLMGRTGNRNAGCRPRRSHVPCSRLPAPAF